MYNRSIKKVWFDNGRIWIQTDLKEELSQKLEVFPALFYADYDDRHNFYIWDNGQSIRWEKIDEDIHISNFYEKESVDYNNNINRLLSQFPFIDLKAFAEYIGIHWILLAKIRFGVTKASHDLEKRIVNSIHELGKEMQAASI